MPDGGAPTEVAPPLLEAVEKMLVQLGKFAPDMLLAFLSAAHACCEAPLRVATACSGCDMIMVCLDMLKQVVRAQFGEEFATVHVFSVEKDDAKRAFLKVQFPAAGAIFCDVREIGNPMAWDVLSESQVVVGDCDLFAASFSFTSRSHHRHVDGDAAVAVTWRGAAAYIQKRKPRMVLLENVEELDRSDGLVSDATHIVGLLKQWGYTARAIHVQARDFGSFPARLRIYFLAVLARDDDGLGFRSFLETLQVMRIHPFPLDRFLIGEEVFQRMQEPDEDSEFRLAKRRRTDSSCKFRDEHCSAFRAFGQEWPIDKKTVEPSLACAVRGTTDRMAELIIFCNRQWPFRNDNPMLEPQFLDANLSIGFTLAPRAAGVTNPWKTVLGCITRGFQGVHAQVPRPRPREYGVHVLDGCGVDAVGRLASGSFLQ